MRGSKTGAELRTFNMLRDIQTRGVAFPKDTVMYKTNSMSFKSAATLGYLEFKDSKFFPRYLDATHEMALNVLKLNREKHQAWEREREKKSEKSIDLQIRTNYAEEIATVPDSVLVQELRNRGFVVAASKLIEL